MRLRPKLRDGKMPYSLRGASASTPIEYRDAQGLRSCRTATCCFGPKAPNPNSHETAVCLWKGSAMITSARDLLRRKLSPQAHSYQAYWHLRCLRWDIRFYVCLV